MTLFLWCAAAGGLYAVLVALLSWDHRHEGPTIALPGRCHHTWETPPRTRGAIGFDFHYCDRKPGHRGACICECGESSVGRR